MAISTLNGIRVLDLTRVLAGPLCTMMLGDLGANVIKVERSDRGDESRSWGPPFDERGESAYYLSINRNKLSIAADLRRAEDRALLYQLASAADVVVENFLPGALARLEFDADALLARNPKLIWCSITGFGHASDRPGYDFVVQAEAGWMAITGEAKGAPMKSGVALADILAGKDATIAILAALAGRAHLVSVEERHLRISLAASARAALINVAQNALVSGTHARRWGNAHANLVPYQLFDARDRSLVIAVGSDDQWQACARALGLDSMARDVALRTNAGRVANRERVVDAIAEVIRHRDASHWIGALSESGVPCGVVKTVLEAIADAAGASPLTGMPSPVGGSVRFPPPKLDEHGANIRRAGWAVFA